MKYYAYQNTKPMSKVWSLFRDLDGMTPEQINRLYGKNNYSHTLEIVKAALNGSISLTDEAVDNFNLSAYEYKCSENDKNGSFNRAKSVVNIVEMDNSEDDINVGYGDISDRKIFSMEDSFEEVMNNTAFESNIKELYGIRSQYIIEQGVDIVSVLIGSLKGIPEAMAELKELISDIKIKDLVTSLCEDSKDGKLLKILESNSFVTA